MSDSVTHFAVFDEAGLPVGFYNNDIYPDVVEYGEPPERTEDDPEPIPPVIARRRNPAIPSEAVELAEAQWREFLDHPGLRRWTGSRVEVYEPPPAPAPVPASVNDYQFAGEAEARGIITTEECDAWVGPGVIPPTLLTKVEQVVDDPAERRRLVLFLKGSKEFPRYHPNTEALAALFGLKTGAAIDDFFTAAGRR